MVEVVAALIWDGDRFLPGGSGDFGENYAGIPSGYLKELKQ